MTVDHGSGRSGDVETSDDETVAPDDPRKPSTPTDLTTPSWKYVIRRTVREFGHDQCTDVAAALTYYAVLSLFPALLVVVSLLGVVGQGQSTVDGILQMVDDLGPSSAVDTVRGPIEQLVNAPAAGWALVVGVLGALWTASGYVGAFGRAMNRIYEIDEGRPVWKLRPLMLVVTAVALVAAGATAVILVVSGPVASSLGEAIGLGDTAVTVWRVAKWPVLLALVVVIVGVLYYVTPNVAQPKFRWLSLGSFIAIGTWILASVILALYISHFGNYDRTYGSLAGAVIFLLWLWITNLALLFGAEFDAELERGRQLQAGIRAEETLQLPERDTRVSAKNDAKLQELVDRGRQLRVGADGDDTEGPR